MDNTDLIKLCIWIFFTQFIYGYYLYSYTKFQTTSITLHCVKSIHPYSNFSGPYFPAFGLNSERYSVSPRTQSECLKIQTRKTPNTDTFHALLDFRLDSILPFSSKLEFYFTFFTSWSSPLHLYSVETFPGGNCVYLTKIGHHYKEVYGTLSSLAKSYENSKRYLQHQNKIINENADTLRPMVLSHGMFKLEFKI